MYKSAHVQLKLDNILDPLEELCFQNLATEPGELPSANLENLPNTWLQAVEIFLDFCPLDKALTNLTPAGPEDFHRSFPT